MSNYRLNSDIIKYKEIDSTNNEAIRLLDKKNLSHTGYLLKSKLLAKEGKIDIGTH